MQKYTVSAANVFLPNDARVHGIYGQAVYLQRDVDELLESIELALSEPETDGAKVREAVRALARHQRDRP